MDKIIAIKNFTAEGKYYFIGDEINPNDISKPTLIKLNENGFIEPLTPKELMAFINNK